MYEWRKMTLDERADALAARQKNFRPWHTPPHRVSRVGNAYLITAACYEHRHFVGRSTRRLEAFEDALLNAVSVAAECVQSWVVLPNHYHVLIRTEQILRVLGGLGVLHGRTSFQWNKEEEMRGRQVWHSAAETAMKSDRHWFATINYIHHNPVKHGYVSQWQDWPYSSAAAFLKDVGREETQALWKEYPLGDYGKGWDEL